MRQWLVAQRSLTGMLQNRQQRKNIQLPWQATPPGFDQIGWLLEHANSKLGNAIELSFGTEPSYTLTVLRHKVKEDAQWMFYKIDRGTSSLEWSYVTGDINMIHNAMCANFPEVDLNMSSPQRGLAANTNILQNLQQVGDPDQSGPIAPTAAKPQGKALMEGELKHLPISNLMQSIAVGKMTGRLEIRGEKDTANIFFIEGAASHCVVRGMEGESAVLELLSWKDGFYRFYHEAPPQKQTVRKRLDALLLEGATLVDQYCHLERLGLNPESYLFRMHPQITEQSFEQIVRQALPVDLNRQKALYQAIDNRSNLLELLRRMPLAKCEWVPVMHNLLGCQLVGFQQQPLPVPEPPKSAIPPTPIDWNVVHQNERALIRSDTGVYTYPVLLGFLQREHARFETLNRSYSLVVLEIGTRQEHSPDLAPLPIKAIKDMAQQIERLKRKCDLLGHYETFALALVLPETSGPSARTFARTLTEVLLCVPVEGVKRVVINTGVGCCPEDAETLETLLT
ncbi:MAG: DUF4388 domain-containing protein, partial [Terriglobales bacterium]